MGDTTEPLVGEQGGKLYLAVTLDLYSCFVVGWVAVRHADVRVQREALDTGPAWTMDSKVKAGTPRGMKRSRVEPLKGAIVEAALGWICCY